MLSDSHNKESIEKTLREGVSTEFWNIIREAIDENIATLTRNFLDDLEDLKDYTSEECKLRMMLYTSKKAQYEKLKGFPLTIVQSFGKPEQTEPDSDPYRKPEDFLPKKDKN